MRSGVLDLHSLARGYKRATNAVEIIARAPHADGSPCHAHADRSPCAGRLCLDCSCGTTGKIKAIRRTSNLRNNLGGDLQGQAMTGGAAGSGTITALGIKGGTSSATSATSLTDTGFGTTAYVNHVVIAGNVWGVITSHTNTVLTVERWIDATSATLATGSTPGATTAYTILPGAAPMMWLAISNDSGAPATTDSSLTGEISTNGFTRALISYSHAAISGGTTTTVGGVLTLSCVFTSTGGSTSAQKCALFNTKTSSTGAMWFENTFTAITGLASGDTLTVTWTINY